MYILTLYIISNINKSIVNDKIKIQYVDDIINFDEDCKSKYYLIINEYIDFYDNYLDLILNNLNDTYINSFKLENSHSYYVKKVQVINIKARDTNVYDNDIFIGIYGNNIDNFNLFYKYKKISKGNNNYSSYLLDLLPEKLIDPVKYHLYFLTNKKIGSCDNINSVYDKQQFYDLFNFNLKRERNNIFSICGLLSNYLDLNPNKIKEYFNEIIGDLVIQDYNNSQIFDNDKRFTTVKTKEIVNSDIFFLYNNTEKLDINLIRSRTKYIVAVTDNIEYKYDYVIKNNNPYYIKNFILSLNTNKKNLLVIGDVDSNYDIMNYKNNLPQIFINQAIENNNNVFLLTDKMSYNRYYEIDEGDCFDYIFCFNDIKVKYKNGCKLIRSSKKTNSYDYTFYENNCTDIINVNNVLKYFEFRNNYEENKKIILIDNDLTRPEIEFLKRLMFLLDDYELDIFITCDINLELNTSRLPSYWRENNVKNYDHGKNIKVYSYELLSDQKYDIALSLSKNRNNKPYTYSYELYYYMLNGYRIVGENSFLNSELIDKYDLGYLLPNNSTTLEYKRVIETLGQVDYTNFNKEIKEYNIINDINYKILKDKNIETNTDELYYEDKYIEHDITDMLFDSEKDINYNYDEKYKNRNKLKIQLYELVKYYKITKISERMVDEMRRSLFNTSKILVDIEKIKKTRTALKLNKLMVLLEYVYDKFMFTYRWFEPYSH